jgi:hypothetical protein
MFLGMSPSPLSGVDIMNVTSACHVYTEGKMSAAPMSTVEAETYTNFTLTWIITEITSTLQSPIVTM